jgi:antirestriction protein ArdC
MTIKNHFDEAVKNIISAMKENNGSWKKCWVSAIPQNYTTKKEYKGFNALYLPFVMMKRGHTNPFFLTFNQAQKLGGKVKKGSKSYPIFFWQFYFSINIIKSNGDNAMVSVKAFSDTDAIKKALSMKEVVDAKIIGKKPFMIMHNIFNAEDIEGIEFEDVENDNNLLEKAEEFVSSTGAEIKEGLMPCYSLTHDFIEIPSIKKFVDSESYYSTLFHELTHWTGAKNRINRVGFYDKGIEEYAYEELVAELGSLFLCMKYNIKIIETQKVLYIKNWITKLENNPKYIWKAASDAKKALSYFDKIIKETRKIA